MTMTEIKGRKKPEAHKSKKRHGCNKHCIRTNVELTNTKTHFFLFRLGLHASFNFFLSFSYSINRFRNESNGIDFVAALPMYVVKRRCSTVYI